MSKFDIYRKDVIKMKKKIISKTYLREADKYQIKLYLDEEDYYVSVKKLVHVTDKFVINNGKTVAMDNGYYIVEIIPKNEKYALRIFLNENKELVEYYIDIIKESGLDEEYNIPYFIDLYLDITILYNGDIHIIDENELEDAYNNSEITREEFDQVIKIKNKLINEIKTGTNKYINLDISKYLEDF